MATSYGEAVEALYRGALGTFVTERKRLAGELKAGGDGTGAARLAKLGRPSISAWAVNQLWWNEREAFEALFATAKRLRSGEHDAGAAHQRALAALRALATSRLVRGEHAASETTLRRVTTTLSALAAGGFDPDPPGALVADRDPPGFELAIDMARFEREPKPKEKPRTPPFVEKAKGKEEAAQQRELAERERKRAAEERRILEQAQARKQAERERLQAALSAARADAVTRRREAERLRHELSTAERSLEKADATVAELKETLASLD